MTTFTTLPGTPLERFTIFTALGIRFWDFALDVPVTNGLEVSARLAGTQYPPLPAVRTGSGVMAFQGLPGLRDVEYPLTSGNSPASSPPRVLSYVITVADTLRRYLPSLFSVDLPLPYRGLFLSNSIGSPDDADARAYLFSAPTRTVSVGMAAVRTTVWDADADRPAAHAALRVTIDGRVYTGIADEEGRALVAFPSPLVRRLTMGSPPGSGQGSPSGMTWPVTVQALYQPGQLRFPLQATPDAAWPWNITPSLKSILDAQQPALIWQTQAGPPVPQWTGNLTYSVELLLRTVLTNPSALSAVLLISQKTTSP